MAWIESHQALEQHPKVLELAEAMGWSVDETLGKLHRLWWWCLDYAPDGRLDKFSAGVLARVFGVSSGAESFITLLIELRWLDSEPEIRVHDWWDYAGRFLQVRYKRTPKIWKEIKRFYGYSVSRTNNRTTTKQSAINNHKPNQPNLTNLRPNQEESSSSGAVPDPVPRTNGTALWTEAEALVTFLNQRTGKHFLARTPAGDHTKTLKLIHELLTQNYTPVQIRQVIANRWLRWGTDPKMQEFLRPSTLFRPSNFENYLGELGVTHDAM